MRRPLTILCGVLAVSVAACGGGDDDAKPRASAPPAPAGWVVKRGPDYAFAHPPGWKVQRERREPRGTIQSVYGPAGRGGLPPQIAVGRTPDDESSFELALRAFRADSQISRARWKVLSERRVKLAGASDARMIEARYLQATPKKTTEPVRTIDLLVRTEGGTQLDLLVRAPEAEFDAARLRAVVDSFRVS